MTKLTSDQFTAYILNPLEKDELVRKWAHLLDDMYFTVSIYPIEGIVNQSNVSRTVKAKKISKSDQS